MLTYGLGIGIVRLTGFPDMSPFIELVSLSFFSWLAVAVAALCTSFRFTLFKVIVTLISTTLLVLQPIPDAPQANRSDLRLLSANSYHGDAVKEILRTASEVNADIVFIVECDIHCGQILQSSNFPFKIIKPGVRAQGAALLSKFPIEDLKQWNTSGFSQSISVTALVSNNTEVVLKLAHPNPPTSSSRDWSDELHRIKKLAAAETNEHLIVAGDFNATEEHKLFRDLVKEGRLAESIPTAGGTWPSRYPSWFGITLDHILIRGFAARNSKILDIDGTDHRALYVELEIL